MEASTILDEFDTELQQLRKAGISVFERADRGMALCQKTLGLLRNEVVLKGFADKAEEIHFFKEIKSVPMGQLVYYSEVRKCELKLPRLGRKPQLKFLRKERERLNRFFQNHIEYHRYLLENRTDGDHLYFLRNQNSIRPLHEGYAYRYDTEFETSHDVLLSTFKGLERYGNYLLELEHRLEAQGKDISVSTELISPYTFTQSPTAAMELIYAFKAAKFIDHGDFEIKAFVEFFCRAFNFEIKDPYGLFKQITQRKTNRAKNMQHLVDALLNALDDRDNYIL